MALEKITGSLHGPSRRSYDDGCGTALALDLIGERWALLVMRELMLGPKRFSDIRADLPGISANTLTQRLDGLEKNGLVVREKLPPPASVQVYGLTEWGYQLLPVMGALGRWAVRSPDHDPNQHFSAVSLMLSFMAMGQPANLAGLEARVGFRLGRENYVLTLKDGGARAARGNPVDVDVVFEGAPAAIAAAVYGGVPLAALEADGAVKVTGDRALAGRFTTLFPLPPRASRPGATS